MASAEYHRNYYLVNREKQLAAAKRRYQARKLDILAYSKQYKLDHPEKVRTWGRTYRNTHKAARRVLTKQYSNTVRSHFSVGKKRAANASLLWAIPFEEFSLLNAKPCFYCGGALPRVGCGLDRIDNSKGYTLDNVLPCCGPCNKARADHYSSAEFKVVIDALNAYRKKVHEQEN